MDLLWFIVLAVVSRWAWLARRDARQAREQALQLQRDFAAMEITLDGLARTAAARMAAGAAETQAAPAPSGAAATPVTPAAPATPSKPAEREPLVARAAVPPPPPMPPQPAAGTLAPAAAAAATPVEAAKPAAIPHPEAPARTGDTADQAWAAARKPRRAMRHRAPLRGQACHRSSRRPGSSPPATGCLKATWSRKSASSSFSSASASC